MWTVSSKVDLEKVEVQGPPIDISLDFNLALTDGDGDVENVTLSVGVNYDVPPLSAPRFEGIVEEEHLKSGSPCRRLCDHRNRQ